MKRKRIAVLLVLALCAMCAFAQASYVGFDKNTYPGDDALPALRKTFRFTGYWLNNPPGASSNTWTGKRALLKQQGFGFLVLFNGRLYAELKGKDAAGLGKADGEATAVAAKREGFPAHVRIFLDMEEGGALLPEQAAYVFAWMDAVEAAGVRAGVYCSAIDVPAGKVRTNTARDLLRLNAKRGKAGKLVLWIANDQCPPAPGCAVAHVRPAAGAPDLEARAIAAWQYAQSPRRMQFSASCPKNAAPDGNCYAPGLPQSPATFIDLNVANSPDPSEAQ